MHTHLSFDVRCCRSRGLRRSQYQRLRRKARGIGQCSHVTRRMRVTRRDAANKKHTVTKTKERTRATIHVSPPSKRTIEHRKAGKREPHSVESKEKHTPSTRKVLLTMEQKDRRNKARRGTRGTEIANRRNKNRDDPDIRKREWRTTKENRSAARAEDRPTYHNDGYKCGVLAVLDAYQDFMNDTTPGKREFQRQAKTELRKWRNV